MKKHTYITILLLLFSSVIFCQNDISKTFCLKGYGLTAISAIKLQDSSQIICGQIYVKFAPLFVDDVFLAKIDKNNNMLWFKIIKTEHKFAQSTIALLSNNTFLLGINYRDDPGNLYCMNDAGTALWRIQDFYGSNIIDLPTESAFMYSLGPSELVRLSYSGKVESAISYSYFNNNPYGTFTNIDKNNIAVTTSILNNKNKYTDTLAVFTMNKKTAKVVSGIKIYTPTNDSIIPIKIFSINKKIAVIGINGYSKKSSNFIFIFDENLKQLSAQKFTSNDASFLNAGIKDINTLTLLLSYDYTKPLVTEYDVSKYELLTTAVKYPSQSSIGQGIFPFLLSPDKTSFFHGVDGLNLFSTSSVANISFCAITKVATQIANYPIKIKIENPYYVDFTTSNTTMNTPVLKESSFTLNAFDMCPNCYCPDTIVTKASICEGSKYQTIKNGKKIEYSKAGIYIDTIKNNGCLDFNELTLTIKNKVLGTLDKFLCTTTPSITIANKTYSKEGTYVDTLQTKNGCDSILTINIKTLKDFSVSLGDDKEILEGESTTLIANSNYSSIIEKYTWLPVGTSTCDTCQRIDIKPTQSQSYIVKANAKGCLATDTVFVKLSNKEFMYIPNAFSPNADGKNDTFRPFTSDIVEKIELFTIFDRWGNQVHEVKNTEPNDENTAWNGTFRGQDCDQNIYTYIVQARLRNGAQKKFVGDVMLMR